VLVVAHAHAVSVVAAVAIWAPPAVLPPSSEENRKKLDICCYDASRFYISILLNLHKINESLEYLVPEFFEILCSSKLQRLSAGFR
jgi:hypothetical protein